MNASGRGAITLVVSFASYFFVYWMGFSLVDGAHESGLDRWGSLLAAIAAGVLVARGLRRSPKGLLSAMGLGAAIAGGTGFCAGFFGPIFLAPDSPQGPMLGLFITGPLGFLVGLVGGAIWWVVRRRKGDRPPVDNKATDDAVRFRRGQHEGRGGKP